MKLSDTELCLLEQLRYVNADLHKIVFSRKYSSESDF